MILRLIEENKPLDEVVFYDTGMEFEAIYKVRDRILPFDEPKRLEKEIKPYKTHPLVGWKMTEDDCLTYCYSNGFDWVENGIDLYSILDRVSCQCCCNKNKKELYNIWRYLPQYWERLKELQSKIDRPMKKFQNKQYGFYGNVFDMEKVFEQLKGGANG